MAGETGEILLTAQFFLMLAIAIASLFFWNARSRMFRVNLYLPLALLVLYVLYEFQVPPEANIRIDLLVLYPLLTLAFLGCCLRLYLGWKISNSIGDKRNT